MLQTDFEYLNKEPLKADFEIKGFEDEHLEKGLCIPSFLP